MLCTTALAAITACTSTARTAARSTTRPATATTTHPQIHVVKVAGLAAPLELPVGYDVAITHRIPRGRAQSLRVFGNGVYWLAEDAESTSGLSRYRRIERLDTTTGDITTLATSGAGVFSGIAVGLDGLVASTETPAPVSACHGHPDCIRPVFELLRPSAPPQVLATSDPETAEAGPDGYLLVQLTQGALLETVDRGRPRIQLWRSTDAPLVDLGHTFPPSLTVTMVGSALVGQRWGGKDTIWTTSETPLPPGLGTGVWQPAGSPTHLAWIVPTLDSATGNVALSTLAGGRFSTPITVATESAVDVIAWIGDCQLLMDGRDEAANPTGLFVADVCKHGAPVTQLLPADLAAQMNVPARWGLAPGLIAFAFNTGKTETLIVLHAPQTG